MPGKKVKAENNGKIPRDLKPMLSSPGKGKVEGDEWIYEFKWDGFRAIAFRDDKVCDIRSRNNKDFNDKFYPLYEALAKWDAQAVIDGEIVALGKNGLPDFAALQTWRSEADGQLVYMVFDLLWLNGENMMELPLERRRARLKEILPPKGIIQYSDNPDATVDDLYALAEEMKLEGLIAKKKDSKYEPGKRTTSWLKIKTEKSQEVVIGGYTRNENSSRKISALLPGIYKNGELVPLTPVGTGFTSKMQELIIEKLRPLVTKKCPFNTIPDFNKPSRFRPDPPKAEVTWVKPELVAEISYRTMAPDGAFRHPSFKGLREDKDASEVVWEDPGIEISTTKNNKLVKNVIKKQEDEGRKTLLNPADKTQVRKLQGHNLKFTNLDKVFWEKEGYTKRDMLNYYYQVAPFILPHIKNRPQTLNRFPNGYKGKSFYQKDVKGKAPDWVKTYPYYSEADEQEKEFLVCSNEASLLYMVNLGCIEINPWSSRTTKPDHPDWCIIDLDPDKNPFDQVISAARETMAVLDDCEIPYYCKTSGSTGLHIYIPFGARYTYEDSKEFARKLVTIVHNRLPKFTSIERLTSKRKGKVYLDFLQNRPQATVAAAYSLRPKPGAPVSMPLYPEEVKKGLKITDFNLGNAIARIRETGDLFEGVNGKGINLKKAHKALDQLKAQG